MNTERVLELAKVIREQPHNSVQKHDVPLLDVMSVHDPNIFNNPDGFNMAKINCGSAGCVCGWAIALWGTEENRPDPPYPGDGGTIERTFQWGAELLDIADGVAAALFDPYPLQLEAIPPGMAANVLEQLAEHYPKVDVGAIWREEIDSWWNQEL